VATAAGHLEQARDYLSESVARLRELDDPFHLGWALCFLGRVDLRLGQPSTARESLQQSLTIFTTAGDVSAILLNLADFAHLALLEHQPERTLRLYGAMTRLRRVTGINIVDLPLNRIPDLDRAMELLGPQATSRLHAQGEAMDMEAAVAYALQEG
jgi:tetratricopeptide (TPR) repeat protein